MRPEFTLKINLTCWPTVSAALQDVTFQYPNRVHFPPYPIACTRSTAQPQHRLGRSTADFLDCNCNDDSIV
eukprot:m.235928 g.235928  ORF g.235928 m.235928 type:complete len:71 (-) comp15767_c0_seq1:2063-2275(-)